MLSNEVAFQNFKASIRSRLAGSHLAINGGRRPGMSVSTDEVEQAIDYFAALYVALSGTLGMAVWPDMLPNLGWSGRLLHSVFCKSPGMWRAFRIWVAQTQRKYPYPTPLVQNEMLLASQQELYVYKSLCALSGIIEIDLHPYLPDGLYAAKADFHLKAATGQDAYVEVVMVSSNANADTVVCADYRERLLRKLGAYHRLGLSPVVIWADQAACPRALAVRLNDILARLGLPTRPPAPPYWYELPREVPLWAARDVLRPGRGSFGGLV